ncbi:protein ENHANCED DISEASE RESISTANCE 4-like [Hibiscus syriacus]|uniref:protein ENHANCED DISEASE RESISTANCE 4-like n=1 Tax=Hibiscus syriacus TaxID=106335 RepID=UPI0019211338|nr:protein ENHANCED DISEASE RESISTANCE 4-like [Hibiscus syriacus]
MATATAPKVRLVRCPKCLLVLPEVADFPVYKCGGCDTILVAKSKKAIAKTTSVLQETEAAANRSFRVSEHGESSSSALQDVLPSPSSQESGGNQGISRLS